MSHPRSWLDVLTDCILTVTDLERHAILPPEWLRESAAKLASQFGPDTGVAIVRAMPGEPSSPWINSLHAVQCGDSGESDEWRERYTFATVSSGMTPEDIIAEVEAINGWRVWQTGDRVPNDKWGHWIETLIDRTGITTLTHCCGPGLSPNKSERGALVFDVWSLDKKWRRNPPPRALFDNIGRALGTCLHRVEQAEQAVAHNGLNQLTPSQRRVAALLMEGLTEKDIAQRLGRSHHTVHQHVKAIYAALAVRSRAEFMASCIPTTTRSARKFAQRSASRKRKQKQR